MEKIDYSNSDLPRGLFNAPSGEMPFLRFEKSGKFGFSSQAFTAKRPNQYRK